MTSNFKKSLITSFTALALTVACALFLPWTAYATTETDLQETVESTAREYNDATFQIESLEAQIAENNARIGALNTDMPKQQDKCNSAIKTLYLLYNNRSTMLSIVLESEDFGSFISTLEYLDRIQQNSLDAVNETKVLKDELEKTQADLAEKMKRAEQEKVKATQALEEAQAAREAVAQAAIAAAAAEAAQASAEQQAAAASSTGTASIETGTTVEEVPTVSSGEVSWSTSKAAFVSEWATRIDNYLDGSPLAGQGSTFASAAWDYGVDPRWSPAISNTESSKGANCFRTYNAWGWGNKSYSSWEEAIDAHVGGLSRSYGYTISYAAAQKYCPYNADYWYRNTYAQMQLI